MQGKCQRLPKCVKKEGHKNINEELSPSNKILQVAISVVSLLLVDMPKIPPLSNLVTTETKFKPCFHTYYSSMGNMHRANENTLNLLQHAHHTFLFSSRKATWS